LTLNYKVSRSGDLSGGNKETERRRERGCPEHVVCPKDPRRVAFPLGGPDKIASRRNKEYPVPALGPHLTVLYLLVRRRYSTRKRERERERETEREIEGGEGRGQAVEANSSGPFGVVPSTKPAVIGLYNGRP